MRTTLTLDEDVAEKARAAVSKLGKPFKYVVNEALRLGLDQIQSPAKRRPYRTRPHRMILREGMQIDNVQELLAQLDGDDAR